MTLRNFTLRNSGSRGGDFLNLAVLLDDDLPVQKAGPFPDVEKGVRLIIINDPVEAVGVPDLLLVVVLPPDFDDKVVRLSVPISDEVQLEFPPLAGVPDLVQVGLDSQPPAEDHGVEIELVDPFSDKNGPL